MYVEIHKDRVRSCDGFEEINGIKIFFSGYLLSDGKLLVDNQCVPDLIKDYKNGLLQQKVSSYNGSFQFVIIDELNKRVLFVQDRFGTLPMYNSQTKSYFKASDNWRKVEDKQKVKISEEAGVESLLLGHVLGDKTMIEGIQEFTPHTITIVSYDNQLKIEKHSYWYYQLEFNAIDNRRKEMEFADLWQEKIKLHADFIHQNNSKALVAVTGGLDSRLIASELDRNQVEIVPMTYGHQFGNYEIQSALQVVDSLKNKLGHFIQYNNEKLMTHVLRMAPSCSRITCAHFSEKDLFFPSLINSFCHYSVSGHSGDTIAGGHLGYRMKTWKSADDVKKHILKYKSLTAMTAISRSSRLRDIIHSGLDQCLDATLDPISMFMKWNIEERQRRYTLRSSMPDFNRLQLNLLPFFDYDVVDFFRTLSFESLVNKKLYINSQVKYLYAHNKRLLNIPNNGKRLRYIRSSFVSEFYGKLKMLSKKGVGIKDDRPGKLYHDEINWESYLTTKLPDWAMAENFPSVMYLENSLYNLHQLQLELTKLNSSY